MVVNTGKFKASSRTPARCSGLVPSATLTVAVANELVAVLSTVGMVKNRISIGTLRAMRSWRSNILKVESHHIAKKSLHHNHRQFTRYFFILPVTDDNTPPVKLNCL